VPGVCRTRVVAYRGEITPHVAPFVTREQEATRPTDKQHRGEL
jgi:hypothetical protein